MSGGTTVLSSLKGIEREVTVMLRAPRARHRTSGRPGSQESTKLAGAWRDSGGLVGEAKEEGGDRRIGSVLRSWQDRLVAAWRKRRD